MTDEDLIDASQIGEEVLRFVESDAGKSLLARAEQYVLETFDELAAADPSQEVQIIRLQERIRLARTFPTWLQELIALGEQARLEWTQRNPREGVDE